MKTDEEIRSTFSLAASTDRRLIVVTFLEVLYDNDENTRRAELIALDLERFLVQNIEGKYMIMADMEPLGKNSHISHQAGEIYKAIGKNPRFEKVAVCGDPDAQTPVMKYFLPLAKLFSNIRWFKTKEEAKSWFNS